MRPQIPERLEQQIKTVAESGGYSSGSELVRDAARRRVDDLKKRPSDKMIKRWLDNQKQIKIVDDSTFPAAEFDETGEIEIIEDATWMTTILAPKVPVQIHGGLESEPVTVSCSILRRLFSSVDEEVLLEAPGYLVGVSSENRFTDAITGAAGVQLRKELDRAGLDRAKLVNTALGMGSTVELGVDGEINPKEMITGWDY
jgi:Arc/MetJ-type ribon-helix-helix transcriptional regulator